jgi:hypothetical protein
MSGTLAGQRLDHAGPASVPPAGFEPAHTAPEGPWELGNAAGHGPARGRSGGASPRIVHGWLRTPFDPGLGNAGQSHLSLARMYTLIRSRPLSSAAKVRAYGLGFGGGPVPGRLLRRRGCAPPGRRRGLGRPRTLGDELLEEFELACARLAMSDAYLANLAHNSVQRSEALRADVRRSLRQMESWPGDL